MRGNEIDLPLLQGRRRIEQGGKRLLSRRKRPADPESQVAVLISGGGFGHARVWVGTVDKGTATPTVCLAASFRLSRAIYRCAAGVLAILNPLPDVADHVIQAKLVGRE
jgi:hypothetical protein